MIQVISIILATALALVVVFKDSYFKKKTPKYFNIVIYSLIIGIGVANVIDVSMSGYIDRTYWFTGEIQGSNFDTPTLKIGSARFVLSSELETIFDLVGDPIKVWIYDGKLQLYTIVRDENGKQMVAVMGNNFIINPNTVSDFNYDEDAIEVLDKNDDVVLQIQMENDGILFCGKFHCKDGRKVAIGNNEIEIRIPGQELIMEFEPIFVYPGEHNLGVRR